MQQNNEGSLEDKLRRLRRNMLSSNVSSSEEEYALAIGKQDGVYLLLPNEKKIIRITTHEHALNRDKVCINQNTLYYALNARIYHVLNASLALGAKICNAEHTPIPQLHSNPLAEEIRKRKLREGKEQPPKPIQREGNVTGLCSINGKLYDFGAFAAGTKTPAIFDTQACPTGKELPIAIRDNSISCLVKWDSVVYDVSDGKLFKTFSSPLGKEKAIEIDGFKIGYACLYQNRVYVAHGDNFRLIIGELEEMLRSGKPIKEIIKSPTQSPPLPPPGKIILNVKLFPHKGTLFAGKLIELPSGPWRSSSARCLEIYDCFSDYSHTESGDINYRTLPLAAKYLGAVPISKEMFDRLIGNEYIFDKIAKPSILAEIRNKIELVYKEAEEQLKQHPSLLEDKIEAKRLFVALRKLRTDVISEYTGFGIEEKDVQAGPLENKFKIYEKMIGRS